MTRSALRPDVTAFFAAAPDFDAMLGTVPLAQMRGMEPAMRDRLDVPVGQLAVNREVTADTEAGQVPVRLFDSR